MPKRLYKRKAGKRQGVYRTRKGHELAYTPNDPVSRRKAKRWAGAMDRATGEK